MEWKRKSREFKQCNAKGTTTCIQTVKIKKIKKNCNKMLTMCILHDEIFFHHFYKLRQ